MSVIAMMLQALLATAIARPERPGPTTFLAQPTAAARALSVAQVASLPAVPVSFDFQCLANAEGVMGDCIVAADGGTRDPSAFLKRLLNPQPISDPLLHAAKDWLRCYRISAVNGRTKITRSVLIRETVAPTDAPPIVAAARRVAAQDLPADTSAVVDLSSFYPPAALRAEVRTRVTATCRVLADHSLLCRDAHTDLPPFTGAVPAWRDPTMDPAFALATIRALAARRVLPVLASGGTSVDHEVQLSVNWVP